MKTIVYLKENPSAEKGAVVEIRYLGEFDPEGKNRGEDLEVYGQHLWENDHYVNSLDARALDASDPYVTFEGAAEQALDIARSKGFHVVNPGFPGEMRKKMERSEIENLEQGLARAYKQLRRRGVAEASLLGYLAIAEGELREGRSHE